MDFLIIQFLNGLASASSLFLVAAGLSIIFGVTRIVNFAHGSFYMLGAYLAVSLTGWLGGATSACGLLAGAPARGAAGRPARRAGRDPAAAPDLPGARAVPAARDLRRRADRRPAGDHRLGAAGPDRAARPGPRRLRSASSASASRNTSCVLIALGPLVLGALYALFRHTRWGILVRAATQDREMVGALGVNQAWLFTSVFALGAGLAALGGALQLPREAVTHDMDLRIIADAFVVVVVGGMGSVLGAFLAALLIGELTAFGIWVFPQITLVLTFLIMAVVLVVRPWGLLGRPELAARTAPEAAAPLLRPASGPWRLLAARGARGPACSCRSWPAATRQFLLIEIFCLALFAPEPALHHGPGRHGLVRPCRLFRPRRLWRGAAGQASRGADGARAARRAAARALPARCCSAGSACASPASIWRCSRSPSPRSSTRSCSSPTRSPAATTAWSASGRRLGRAAPSSITISL